MAHSVFISYAAENREVANAICSSLEAAGVNCWIAPRDVLPGMFYAKAIVGAIRASRIMVLLFSSDSNESPQVIREVERAVSRALPIIAFQIENIPLSDEMEFYISSHHWLDASQPPLEKHLKSLVAAVKQLLELAREAPTAVALNVCQNCGQVYSEGVNFCIHCGHQLSPANQTEIAEKQEIVSPAPSLTPPALTTATASALKESSTPAEFRGRAKAAAARVLRGHEHSISSVAISPGDRAVASGSRDQTVKLWDIETGELKRTLDHGAEVYAVNFSPDGKTLLSRGNVNVATEVLLWETETGLLKQTLKPGSKVYSVDFSPDGDLLAIGCHDYSVKLFDTRTWELQQVLENESRVLSVKFSPDGEVLACGTLEDLRLWDLRAWLAQRTRPTEPDGASVIATPERRIFQREFGTVLVTCAPDGKTLASLREGGKELQLWDARTGELKHTQHSRSAMYTAAFSPDSRVLACGGLDRTVELWDAETWTLRDTLSGHDDIVVSIAFSADGRTLASGSWDQTVRLWSLDEKESRETDDLFKRDEPATLDIEDISVEVLSDIHRAAGEESLTLLNLTGVTAINLTGHEGSVTSLAFSPDGSVLASGSGDTTVRLWDARTGELQKSWKAHEVEVTAVVFAPDGATLMSGSYDRMVRLWKAQTGELQRTLIWHRNPTVDAVAFSPDGLIGASGGQMSQRLENGEIERSGEINLWDARTLDFKRTLAGHEFSVTSLAFTPDSLTLASGSWDRTVKLWHAQTGELKRTLEGHSGAVNYIAFSPDGKTLASAGSDETAIVWDVETGELIHKLTGHSDRVLSVAFSPDGHLLASASGQHQQWGEVKLWDAQTGQLKQTLRGHRGAITALRFAPDGTALASGSTDHTIRLWQIGQLLNERPKRLLWVDDQPASNGYVIEELRQEGIEIILASTTAEGMKALTSSGQAIDAVISVMGRGEEGAQRSQAGLMLVRAMRGAGINTPIFVFSGLDNNEEVMAAGANGATTSSRELRQFLKAIGI